MTIAVLAMLLVVAVLVVVVVAGEKWRKEDVTALEAIDSIN